MRVKRQVDGIEREVAEDVGPYHAPRQVRTRTPCPHTHAMHAPGRARRPRRAVTHGTTSGTPRARGPPGTSAPTTHRAMSAHAHRAPHTHAMRAPGRARRPRRAAPTGRPRDDIGDAHGDAGRRGRRPLPRSTPHPHGRARRPRRAVTHGTTSGTPTGARAAGDVGPYHAPRHIRTRTPRAHLVGRDVLGAPLPTGRPRDDIGDAHGRAGRRGRRPLPRSTPHPHGRARRPRRAAPTGRPRNDIGDAHGHAGRRDVGPYHALRHVRTRTSRAAHARHVRTRAPCLPCQRIETLMGFRNAAAKSRTRACHAFASFTAPAPLQVAPAQ